MSLWVDVDCIDENGDKTDIDLGSGGHLMGFESFRYSVWGAPIMEKLGLSLLPSLAKTAFIFVEGDKLDQLQVEALTIQENVELVIEHIPADEQFIMHRTNNVIRAVDIAKGCGGTVMIG